MKIVIAEDGKDHARILIAALRRGGYDIHWFENGVDAYEYIVSNPAPDLLITDVMMPGMSGFELLGKLKAEGRMPPTLVLTSKQREEDVVRGLELGVLDYVTKPFSPTVVVAKVKNALARKAG